MEKIDYMNMLVLEGEQALEHSIPRDVVSYLLIGIRTMIKRMEKESQEKRSFEIKSCHSDIFNNISCLASDTEYGFFNSEHDIRPGHATWIDKDNAEKLYLLFRRDLIVGE